MNDKMNGIQFLVVAIVLALGTGTLMAHPGHPLHSEGLSHLLGSPFHVVALALMGTSLLVGGAFLRSRLGRVLCRGCGVLALCGAAWLSGLVA